MQGKAVEVSKGRSVLLFDEEDLQDTIKPGSASTSSAAGASGDPVLNQGIQRYLKKHDSGSSRQGSKGKPEQADDEEHSGITDDEDEPFDGEPDYDVVGRHTLKASNQALAEVMAEVNGLFIKGTATAGQDKAKAPVPTPPKPAAKKP